jgi:hypothetical protein
MMTALCHVFLFDRARAILKKILSGGPDNDVVESIE